MKFLLGGALALLATVAPAQARLVKQADGQYQLVLDGIKTVLKIPTNGTVQMQRGAKGFVSGTVSYIDSGAISITRATAFVRDGDQLWTKTGYVANGPLLVYGMYGPWLTPMSALLYQKGQFLDLGVAARAQLLKDGSVKGYFYVGEDGKPLSGTILDIPAPYYKQWFGWKNGQRTLLGRQPAPSIVTDM